MLTFIIYSVTLWVAGIFISLFVCDTFKYLHLGCLNSLLTFVN